MAQQVYKFELLGGVHTDAKLQEFKKGDVVIATQDLAAIHGHNKWRVYLGNKKGRFLAVTPDEPELEDVTPVAVAAPVVQPAAAPSATTTTTAPPQPETVKATQDTPPTPEGDEAGGQVPETANGGQDFTERFTGASENGLKVIKQGGKYQIFDEGDLEDALNKDTPITNQDGVKDWLKDYLSGDED